MAYRLMAADYDLTLTHSDHKVSQHTREVIAEVFAAGRMVTLASGRLGGSAAVVNGMFPGDVPLIVGNGAALQSSATGEILWEQLIGERDALALLRWCRRRGLTTIVYSRAGLYADRLNMASDLYNKNSSVTVEKLPSPEFAAASGLYKALLLGSPLSVRRACKALAEDPPCEVDFFTSGPSQLEIVAKGVNKGAALVRAAAMLGIPIEETIAIGDGENDISMLRAAGLGIAMENAPDNVKAAADVIAPPCDRDGAAQAMEKYLLGKE